MNQRNRKSGNQVAVRIHACQRCGGDAFIDLLDEPEWRCLQCGRLVPDLVLTEQSPVKLPVAA